MGLSRNPFRDAYHRALEMAWRFFLIGAALVYLGGNLVFACLYLLQPGAIDKARPGSLADAFFFSVQTMATIGYGVMSPATLYANCIMTAETLFGMILFAVVTGLIFARFSRPTARVLFSKVAVVAPFDGVPTLMVRMGNERANQIVQAEVQLAMVRDERTREGHSMRRFYDLPLVRSRTPIFAMTFSVMHPLDAVSPLAGVTQEQLERERTEIIVSVTGLDETMSQTVHARCSYLAHEILFDRRYADVIGATPDGTRRSIDYRRFHDTVPLAVADATAAISRPTPNEPTTSRPETENGGLKSPPFSRVDAET